MATMEGFASMGARRALPRGARAFDVAEKRSPPLRVGVGRAFQPPSATRRNSAREDVVTSLLKG
jgi:hypothetical protein